MSRIMLINSLFSFFKNILSPKDTPKTEPDTMKYLIAGLGNIGNDYEGTRRSEERRVGERVCMLV